MAIIRVKPGAVTAQDGTYPELRGGRTGELLSSDAHGRYQEPTYRKTMFSAATQSGQTFGTALSTTAVGLILSNPVGSSVNLVINKISYAMNVIPTTVGIFGLAVGSNVSTNVTHTTPVAPISNFIGASTGPSAKTDTSATLPTAPVWFCFFSNNQTATTQPPAQILDLEGSLILGAGGYALISATGTAPASGLFASIQWEEIPL